MNDTVQAFDCVLTIANRAWEIACSLFACLSIANYVKIHILQSKTSNSKPHI